MTPGGAAGALLVERPGGAVLFATRGTAYTARQLLRDAERLANELPDAAYLCNLCQDRYCFTVTLLAAVLRGQISLHSSDRSPGALRQLADRFHPLVCVSEGGTPRNPLAEHIVRLRSDPVTGSPANPAIPASRHVATVFTSGTTGAPAGWEKTWGMLVSRSKAAGQRFHLAGEAASMVGTVPPQHMYGFETTVLLPLHTNVASWCGPAFYPRDVADALHSMPAPRVLVTTPLQMRSLLDADVDLPSLRCVISATAALDMALARLAEQRWGTKALEIYGATEFGSIASRRTSEGPTWTTYDQVRLIRETQGGGVSVHTPDSPARIMADEVELESATRFVLLGRHADMVKLGGRRASLAGLNAILTGLAGVEDGVFLAPEDLDERPGARLLAFVVAPARRPEDLLEELRCRMEPVFLPRRVIRVAALPRNETGKLTRASLLGLLEGAGARTKPDR